MSPEENDPQRIAAAAEKALSHVRRFRPGAQAKAWAELLDELHQAKQVLSDIPDGKLIRTSATRMIVASTLPPT